MSNRLIRQEEYRLEKKLVFENIRRVFFTSCISVLIVPIMILTGKLRAAETFDVVKSVMICFEVFSVLAAVFSAVALRSRDVHISRMVYRAFWLVFEVFGFTVIYAEMENGAGFSFYTCLMLTVYLVPAMALKEKVYYIVTLALYTIFMSIKFGIGSDSVLNLVLANVMLFGFSAVSRNHLVERLAYREHEREQRDSESIDSMTGLLNARGFEKKVFYSLGDCISERRRISVLVIDIDEMNRYNDSYGCDHGDECIRLVSSLIRQVLLRYTDNICRLDGGRFVAYLEGGNDMLPVKAAEKLRTVVEAKRIPQGRRAGMQFVTVSIGAASGIPRSESDYREIYDEAEDSMYEAKERGKNITVYEEQVYGQYKKASY